MYPKNMCEVYQARVNMASGKWQVELVECAGLLVLELVFR
jgi:hypothetical protein